MGINCHFEQVGRIKMLVIVQNFEIRQTEISEYMPQTYQVIKNTEIGQKILFETEYLDEAIEFLSKTKNKEIHKINNFKQLIETTLKTKQELTIKSTITIR